MHARRTLYPVVPELLVCGTNGKMSGMEEVLVVNGLSPTLGFAPNGCTQCAAAPRVCTHALLTFSR